MKSSSVRLVLRHLAVKPRQHVFHFGVDTKLPRTSTTITPARGAMKIKLSTSLTHHRSPTIPLTGVDSTLVQSRADHGVVDLSWVGSITPGATDHWNFNLLKVVWSGASRGKSAPARDPAFGTVGWCSDGLGKTHQVYEPTKRERRLVDRLVIEPALVD